MLKEEEDNLNKKMKKDGHRFKIPLVILLMSFFILSSPFVYSENEVVVLLDFSDLNQFSYNISHDGSSYTKVGARTGFHHLLPNSLYLNGYFTSNHVATYLYNSSGFGDANYPNQNFLVFNAGDDGGQDLNFAFIELENPIYIQNFTLDVESFNNGQGAHLVCFADDINITFCAGLFTASCNLFVNVPDEFNTLQANLEIGCEEMANHADTVVPYTFKRTERTMDTFISSSSGRLTENSFNDVEVTRIGLISANSGNTGSGRYSLVNISFVNGTNALPRQTINYSSKNLCLNEDGYAEFNYTITAIDQENDSILYGNNVINWYRKDLFYREDFHKFDCAHNYDYLNSSNYITEHGSLTNQNLYLLWYLNYARGYTISTIFSGYDEDGNCDAGLATWEEHDYFTIKPDSIYEDDIEVWLLEEIPFNNTEYNKIFLDSKLNNLVNISYNQLSNGSLDISIDGIRRFTRVHSTNEEIFFYIEINKSSSQILVEIIWESIIGDGFSYNKSQNIDNWYGISFENIDKNKNSIDSYWILKRIITEGSNFEPVIDYSESYTVPIVFNTTGTQFIDFYVTDSPNNNLGRYNLETITVSVRGSRYCPSEEGLPPYKQGPLAITQFFKPILSETGLDTELNTVLILGYFILLVILIWVTKTFLFAWLITSIIGFLVGIGFANIANFTTLTVLLVVSIIANLALGRR